MLGRTHATSGPVVALAALPLINMGLSALDRPEVAGWALVPFCVAAAGGAMLPDMDHRHATVAQSLGPVTKAAAIGIETVSGGHRNGTHSILGVLAFTALTYFVAMWNQWAYGAWLAFLVAIASAAMFKRFKKGSVIAHTLLTIGIGVGVVYLSGTTYLPIDAIVSGVAIGTVAHILGDMLTEQGCPLFWPFSKARFKFANFTTGEMWETVTFWLLTIALPVLVLWRTGWGSWLLDWLASLGV